jgi:3-dehydrosphinganine reductase
MCGTGAHVTIFARRQKPLEEAKAELLASRKNGSQEINAVSVDLSDSTKVRLQMMSLGELIWLTLRQVDQVFRAQTRLADVLYCSAGGCQTQCGYLTEITPHDLESCMRNNYFTAAFSSQVMLKIWTEQDKKTEVIADPTHRRIVFINSAGAFVGLPGYTAYTRMHMIFKSA